MNRLGRWLLCSFSQISACIQILFGLELPPWTAPWCVQAISVGMLTVPYSLFSAGPYEQTVSPYVRPACAITTNNTGYCFDAEPPYREAKSLSYALESTENRQVVFKPSTSGGPNDGFTHGKWLPMPRGVAWKVHAASFTDWTVCMTLTHVCTVY